MDNQNADCCLCAEDWTALEARLHRAKQALLLAQEQHCEAAYDFLAARAEVRQRLEALFPEQESGMEQAVLQEKISR